MKQNLMNMDKPNDVAIKRSSSTPFRAPSGGPRLPFRFEEAFKEGNFSIFFQLFEI